MAVLTRSVYETVALMGQRLHHGGFGPGVWVWGRPGGVRESMGLRWEGLLKWGQGR